MQDLDDLVSNLEAATQASTDLKEIMLQDLSFFETACGGTTGSLDPILSAIDASKVALAQFILVGFDMQQLLSCEELNSIYIKLAHGSVCTYLPDTFAWMFCTMSIILLSGMILYTLRSALLPNKEIRDDKNEESVVDMDHEMYLPSMIEPNKRHPNIHYDRQSMKSIRYDRNSNNTFDNSLNNTLNYDGRSKISFKTNTNSLEDDEKYQFSVGSPSFDDQPPNDTDTNNESAVREDRASNDGTADVPINDEQRNDSITGDSVFNFDLNANEDTNTVNTEDVTKYENSIAESLHEENSTANSNEDGQRINNTEEKSRISNTDGTKQGVEVSRVSTPEGGGVYIQDSGRFSV